MIHLLLSYLISLLRSSDDRKMASSTSTNPWWQWGIKGKLSPRTASVLRCNSAVTLAWISIQHDRADTKPSNIVINILTLRDGRRTLSSNDWSSCWVYKSGSRSIKLLRSQLLASLIVLDEHIVCIRNSQTTRDQLRLTDIPSVRSMTTNHRSIGY